MSSKDLILYTDGSFRDSKAGWGYHGYFYEDTPMRARANLKHQPTSNGFQTIQDLEETCTVVKYIDGFGEVKGTQTNNSAELMALIKAMEYALEHKAKSLKIFTDSQYARMGVLRGIPMWTENGWKKKNGETIASKKLWVHAHELLQALDKANIPYEIIKVKGHSGDTGNDRADINAYRGTQTPKGRVFETSADSINRLKKIDINPLILETRLLFSKPNEGPDYTYYSYNLGRLHNYGFKSGEKPKSKLRKSDLLLGRRISEATFSVLKTHIREDYLEDLMESHQSVLGVEDGMLSIMNLDIVCNARNRQQIEQLGVHGIIVHDDIQCLSTPTHGLISKVLNPPRLAFDAVGTFNSIQEQLEAYLADKLGKNIIKTNITDQLYEPTKVKGKEVFRLKKEITSQVKHLDIKVEIKGEKHLIKLIPSIDLPTRNKLSRIGPILEKAEMLVTLTSPKAFSYTTVFKTLDGSAIYSSPYVQFLTKT